MMHSSSLKPIPIGRALLSLWLLVQLLLLNGSLVHPAELAQVDNPAEAPWEGQTEVADLPQPLQYAISRDLGHDNPAYHITTQPDGGYLANNPRNGMKVHLHSDDMRVRFGEHSWSLSLDAWGRGQVLEHLPVASNGQLDTNRLSFSRGILTEWYHNGPLGIQQGWTLAQPPGGVRDEPLALVLTQSGDLRGVVAGDRASLVLADRAGVVQLRYGGLLAYDADQQPLPAWFEAQGEKVVVRVEDDQAVYPVTIDPWLQATKLTTSQGVDKDYVGRALAVSADGSTVVAGVRYGSISGTLQGAVYVYTRGNDWVSTPLYTARLSADDAEDEDFLGNSVAVSADGSVVVAGAYGEDGDGEDRGAIYVFTRPQAGWQRSTQTAKLTASDGVNGDQLGFSVAISADGSTLLAGSPFHDAERGAVYVFERPAEGWVDDVESAKLTASDGAAGDRLGDAIASSADGNTLAAGAYLNAAGGDRRGAVYLYERPTGDWESATQDAKLTARDGANNDNLGHAVVLSSDGSTLVAGAPWDHTGSVSSGSAYVFLRPTNNWDDKTQDAKLIPSDGGENDNFGSSLALSANGSTLVAGSVFNAAGGDERGAAYVYVRPDSGWEDAAETGKLTASDGEDEDALGESVALSADGGTLVAGAPWNNAGGLRCGAAYVYLRPASNWGSSTEDAKLTACDGGDGDNMGRSAGIDSSGATLVAGAPYNDTGGADRGAAYIYQRPAIGWLGNAIFTAKLTAGDGEDEDYLGWSVALSADGDTLAVGAPYEDGAGSNLGAVYVFERPVGGWITAATGVKLTAGDALDGDNLGRSVAISDDGGVIIAGAPYHDTGGTNRGTAYVFVRPSTLWESVTEDAKLTASDGEGGDHFGWSVALSGDGQHAAVGAPNNNASGDNRGAAYLFEQPDNGWGDTTQLAKLTAGDGVDYDQHGWSIALSRDGETLVVGAPEQDAGGSYRGAVYLFVRSTTGWEDQTHTAKLTANDGDDQDWLGWSVSVDADGDTVAAGAFGNAVEGVRQGAVYRYERPQSGWSDTAAFTTKLTANDGELGDDLGRSVALSADGNSVIAGAPDQDVVYAGSDRGAAYVFAMLTAPVFTSGALPTPLQIGTAYSFTFTASGNPPPVFVLAAGSLPPGLSMDTNTGLLSGTPTTAGTYNLTISAVNNVEPAAIQEVTLVVQKIATTTTITAHAPDPSVVGQAVLVRFTVTTGWGMPTGNVIVGDGTDSCTGTVSAGSCTLTFSTPGTKSLTAAYTGDSNYLSSTSAVMDHTVLGSEGRTELIFLPLVITMNP